MNKTTHDFEDWFDTLRLIVRDRTGVTFCDRASVRDDYDAGRDMHDVADEIVQEYGEC